MAASSPRNDFVKNYRVHPTHWLISTQVLMVSFYNAHLNFYPNYIQMVLRWCKLAWHGVVGDPVEPLIFCGAFPFLALTTYLGWKAFTAKPDEGSDSGVSYS